MPKRSADKANLNFVPKDALKEARALRSNAKCFDDLEKVKRMLNQVISVSEEGSDEWVDAGIFLATLLLQEEKQDQRTTEIAKLLNERGFSYRLSKDALTQNHKSMEVIDKSNTSESQVLSKPSEKFACAWDDSLPEYLISKLNQAFHPTSTFWSSHNYSDGSGGNDPSPYFSYIVPLKDAADDKHLKEAQSTTVLDQIIRDIQKRVAAHFPDVMGCAAAEWWAHCRPHSSGHQLHFDSDDEGRGGVRNPVCSTVTNLSTHTFGGETLVTTQSSKGTSLATNGWLCSNRHNRLLTFRGDLLHGVVPGPGIGPGNIDVKRTTFMVAFWKRIRIQDDPGPGAARPFSRVKEESWATPLMEKIENVTHNCHEWTKCKPAVNCFFEVPVWEDVDLQRNEDDGLSLRQVKKYKLLPPYDEFFQFYS
jgi:hypothetical protein